METAGVLSQWQKRLLLQRSLPPDIIAELEDLLIKNQTEAGPLPYKDLKDHLYESFAPRPEEAFKLALGLVMTGKPSQLAKKLINTLCPKHPTLENCCLEGVISGLWRDKLPKDVRNQVANYSLVGKDIQKATLQHADAVYASVTNTHTVAAVTTTTRAPVNAQARAQQPLAAPVSFDLDESADEPALQVPVAAYNNYRGAGNEGNRGGYSRRPWQNRGASRGGNSPKPKVKVNVEAKVLVKTSDSRKLRKTRVQKIRHRPVAPFIGNLAAMQHFAGSP